MTVTAACTLHRPVVQHCDGEIGLGVDEDGADAVGMLDDGDARFGNDGFDERMTAPGNDQVDIIALLAKESRLTIL